MLSSGTQLANVDILHMHVFFLVLQTSLEFKMLHGACVLCGDVITAEFHEHRKLTLL